MPKRGEVNISKNFDIVDGFLDDDTSAPRNINKPSDDFWGVFTYMQSLLWKPIKMVIPGFIQAMTGQEIVDSIKPNINSDWVSISIDGSKYDSTQFAELMEMTDDRLFDIIRPDIIKWLEQDEWIDPISSATSLIESAKKKDYFLFTKIPGATLPIMPKKIMKAFYNMDMIRDKNNSDEYFWLLAVGSTFSGHPTRTTLGNTLRSLLYFYFYLSQAGIDTPWNSQYCYVIAAGDDTWAWIHPQYAQAVKQSIENLTLKTKDDSNPTGLGQVVKTIAMGKYYEIDFCSKISIAKNIQDWWLYTDLRKVLFQKNNYYGDNAEIKRNPAIHSTAIYDSVKSEKACYLLEAILEERIKHLGGFSNSQVDYIDPFKKMFLKDNINDYRHEMELRDLLDIDLATLYIAAKYNSVRKF